MAQIVLDRPRILAIVGELVSAAMPQNVAGDQERNTQVPGAASASPRALLADRRHRSLGCGLHDDDSNARRHERWIVRNVVLVAEQELQGVRSRLKRNLRLGLAGAEVEVIEIVGNGLIERRQLRVDEQVVMTRIVMLQAGGRNSHAAQAEADGHLGRQLRAVREPDEMHPSSFWRGCRTAGSGLLRPAYAARDEGGKGQRYEGRAPVGRNDLSPMGLHADISLSCGRFAL